MSTTSVRQYNFVDDRNNGIPITASRVDAEFDNVIAKLNQKVIVAATAPSVPIEGQLWYDSTNDQVKQYRNSEWLIMGAVHYGSSAPSTPQSGDTWIDSSGSEVVVKVRNKANGAWVTIAQSTDGLTVTGEMKMWPTDTAPTGYLLCYGQAVSRTTYASLFALISTTFGVGDGSTTFNLPDMRGRVPLGQDDMGGSSANRVTDAAADSIGGTLGSETHTLTTTEMPAHTHELTMRNSNGAGSLIQESANSGGSGAQTTGSSGSGGAHNNLQPSLTINYIIKT